MALAGMARTTGAHRPRFIVEVNRPALASLGKSLSDVWEFFATYGYRVHTFRHWTITEPEPVETLADLDRACPAGGLVDILALPS